MRGVLFNIVLFVIGFFLFNFVFTSYVNAQADYTIKEFNSTIELLKNTDLSVTEEIQVEFYTPKHGIFRIIPVSYSARGRSINADFTLLSVTDQAGRKINVEKSKLNRSVKLKIGDPDISITGEQVYLIRYRLSDVVRQFENYDEVYWNVVGNEWDTVIENASLKFSSEFAEIKNNVCYVGVVGTSQSNCIFTRTGNSIQANSTVTLGSGKDFTVVFTLDKNNNLVYPTRKDRLMKTLKDNWDYFPTFLPLTLMLILWFKKGRDKRFVGDNVYYEPDDKTTKNRSPFAREHIPLVYHPIDSLTPAEVGTIVDEKVDIEDVMAEIVELARLGHIDLVRIKTGGWFGKDTYAFIKNDKDEENLRDYQKLLIKEIFRSNVVHKSVKSAEKIFKKNKSELEKVRKLLIKKEYVINAALENNFYESLPRFKEKLYEGLSTRGYFDGNPDKTRKKWVGLFVGLVVISVVLSSFTSSITGNMGPVIVTLLTAIPGYFIAYYMPRKTAKGYMFKRQAEGLRFYLRKGEWRYEIQEKKLFLEDMLPLAISLGVVGKLTKDMGNLGVKPPNYIYGFNTSNFSSDFRSFESGVSKSMLSSPGGKYSGSGSWTGGSGFSGGSSGGGFGGGGGGSW